MGTSCINKSKDWKLKPIRKLHQTCALSISFWPWHTEIMLNSKLRVLTLFMAHHDHGMTSKTPKTTDNSCIFSKVSVPCKGRKISNKSLNVITRMGAFRMASNQNLLPRGEVLIRFFKKLLNFFLKTLYFVNNVHFSG